MFDKLDKFFKFTTPLLLLVVYCMGAWETISWLLLGTWLVSLALAWLNKRLDKAGD